MKIAIYNEPYGAALGGSEMCVAVLAEALSRRHQVDLLHHRRTMTAETLGRYTGVDLSRIALRLIPYPIAAGERTGNVWNRYRSEKMAESQLSSPYDLFIAFVHEAPPFCAATVGMLMVLFPLHDPTRADFELKSFHWGSLQERLRLAWGKWKLHSRLGGYQTRVAISAFTQRWTKRRWNTHCEVVFPPIEVDIPAREKCEGILSVGRFAVPTHGHGKKQLEMLHAFQRIRLSGWTNWQYDCVGACGSSERELGFLAETRRLADAIGARVSVNLDREQLRSLYQKAKLFWHATGMDVDEELDPGLMEHFGISTVEAMAAGCVPVVYSKGGQAEIVEHGVSGYLWNTVDEWHSYTTRLMGDPALWRRMSDGARDRARIFDRQSYVKQVKSLLAPHVPEGGMR